MDVTWRLGIQLLAWRAWYWARLTDGSWEKTVYRRGPGGRGAGGKGVDGKGGAPGGVREPRRPSPSSGAASIEVPLPADDGGGDRLGPFGPVADG
jgi:hypothetical protein